MTLLAHRSLPLLCTLVLLACGAKGEEDDGSTTSGGDGGGDDGGNCFAPPCGTDGGGDDGGSGSGGTATGGDDGGTGTDDGGTGGGACGDAGTCSAGEFCDWAVNSCGTAEYDTGACAPSPDGCGGVYEPVCGCDGQVHSNACDASASGTDVDAEGGCEAPDGYFGCGFMFCDAQTQYCNLSTSDVGGEPDYYSCPALPGGCDTDPTCDCLTEEPCFEFSCEMTADGGMIIICPGG